jgi:flagellar protein FlbT
MSLKIVLKPGEKALIGGSMIVNGKRRCEFEVLNDVPVLRGSEVMAVEDAVTPCRRLYFATMRLYAEPKLRGELLPVFSEACGEVLSLGVEALTKSVLDASEDVASGRLYAALRRFRGLVDIEREALSEELSATAAAGRRRAGLLDSDA